MTRLPRMVKFLNLTKIAPLLLLLLLPSAVAAQTVTTQGVDRVGDLTFKIAQEGLAPGASVVYSLGATVNVTYQCTRKGQSIPLDVTFGASWVEQWTAQAKTNGTIRTAVTLLLPDGSAGLCSNGWTAEPTWVRYSNLALDANGVPLTIGSYERTLK